MQSDATAVLWDDEGGNHRGQHCAPGTWITLPAGTRYGSVAGPDGAVYMIRPEGGQTARTTFLAPADQPRSAPSFTPEVS